MFRFVYIFFYIVMLILIVFIGFYMHAPFLYIIMHQWTKANSLYMQNMQFYHAGLKQL